MSLFPAYGNDTNNHSEETDKEKEWLVNNSFQNATSALSDKPAIKEIAVPTDKQEKPSDKRSNSDSGSEYVKSKRKRSSHKTKKKKRQKEDGNSINSETPSLSMIDNETDNALYSIDTNRQIIYLKMKTLTKHIKPRYNRYFSRGLMPFRIFRNDKVRRRDRYFNFIQSGDRNEEEIKEDEAEAKKKVEELNKKLTENPMDTDTWIELVDFQNDFYKFQDIGYKSVYERERAATQRKLNILDKALTVNPNNEDLQKMWLYVATTALPSEDVSNQIENFIKNSGGNMTLWLGLIATTQQSLSRCTFPSVSKLYEKAISNYQRVKSNDSDSSLLEILFHYCQFLNHSGHWEHLLTLLKVNLQLNLGRSFSYDFDVSDERSKSLENNILSLEKLPLWHMWSRMEELREGIHFIPASNSTDYPQRCVSSESIVNFVLHFQSEYHFQLIVSAIMSLKVPLLPSSDVLLSEVICSPGLPWILDSVELVLSSVLTSPAVKLKTEHLKHLKRLIKNPQYLRNYHGQSEYLETVCKTFETCLDCLTDRQKTAVGVWWLRFQRWIFLLDKHELASLPKERKKPKSVFKDFLKIKENRDNILYYREYSLLEFDQGSVGSSIKTLETLISSKPPVLNMAEINDQGALCSIYRTLCEVLIANDEKDRAIELLTNLGNGKPIENKPSSDSSLIALRKFEHSAIELIYQLKSIECDLEDFMLPQFATEWISCYIWLIGLIKSPSEVIDYMKRACDLLDKCTCLLSSRVRECLWENVVTVLWTFESDDHKNIERILCQAFTDFPRNLTILSFMATKDLERSRLWGTVIQSFLTPSTVLGAIMLSLVALERFRKDPEPLVNRITGLFQRLSSREGKLSSVIHGLRLRFLNQYDNPRLKLAQVQALESCPWNKRIYTDSILLLPSELMQLTDILIEKELRIHITPDEIQEMRD